MRKHAKMRAVQQSYREKKKKKAAENKEMLRGSRGSFHLLAFCFFIFSSVSRVVARIKWKSGGHVD